MTTMKMTMWAAAGAILTAWGCGEQAPTAPATGNAPAAGTAAATPAPKDKELNLFAWSEYVPQAVIDGFTAETGIRVNYETFASNEEMLAKLVAGAAQYDLIQPSEYTVEVLIQRGLLEKLDKAMLPNIKNIDPQYTNLGHDPNLDYSVPWMIGTVGIVVNTDAVKDPITSYADVFQEKYKNRIVALDDNREMVSWALASLGIDPNDITTENLEKARPVLGKWVQLIKLYDSDSPKTALLNGEVDLGIVWSGEGALCYQEDKKYAWVLPQDAHMFIDSLCIPKGAPHKEAAHLFINYILRPEVSKLISDDFPYTNPNAEAVKLLSDEQRANPASYPPGNPALKIFKDIGDAATQIDEMVTDVRNKS